MKAIKWAAIMNDQEFEEKMKQLERQEMIVEVLVWAIALATVVGLLVTFDW